MNESKSAPGPANHRLEDAVAYHHGELEPAERAEFEEHLKICAGCREAVATSDVLFTNLAAALQGAVPRRSTDEILDIMAKEERRLQAEDQQRGTPSRASALLRPRWHWRSKALTLVAAAVVLLLLASLYLLMRPRNPAREIYVPPKEQH